MTNVYFVRHAQPDFLVKDDRIRSLTTEGLADANEVSKVLKDKAIWKLYSSPYKRSIDTIKDLAMCMQLDIEKIEAFRERKTGFGWDKEMKLL